MPPTPEPKTMLTREDIVHLCGDLPDWKIARIPEASEASNEDLTIALTWAPGKDDVTDQPTTPSRAGQPMRTKSS